MEYTKKQKLDIVRTEALRIWSYLNETIDFIENKYYQYEEFDINELLIYCKSCEESYEEIKNLTYELESE